MERKPLDTLKNIRIVPLMKKKVFIAALNQKKILNILYSEQGPIVLSFIGSRVCLSTLLHYCLANLKVFGKGGLC